MNLRTLVSTLVLASLCFTTAEAVAQATFNGDTPCARASRLESNTRCDDGRQGETVVIEHELEIRTRTESVTIPTRQCAAEIELSYAQKDTLADVDGTIANATCGASSGSFVLSIRTTNEAGEQTTQEITETWMRDDDQPVSFSAEYPIGENVDLVRVRALRSRCMCAEAPP